MSAMNIKKKTTVMRKKLHWSKNKGFQREISKSYHYFPSNGILNKYILNLLKEHINHS